MAAAIGNHSTLRVLVKSQGINLNEQVCLSKEYVYNNIALWEAVLGEVVIDSMVSTRC